MTEGFSDMQNWRFYVRERLYAYIDSYIQVTSTRIFYPKPQLYPHTYEARDQGH
jgi:hypothetical protein